MDFLLMIKKVVNKYIYLIYTPINKLRFKLNHVSYGTNLKVRGNIYVFRHYSSAKLRIGNNVSINSSSWANPIGAGDKTYFQLLDNSEIIIGNNCGISNVAFTCATRIVLGNNVLLGAGCKVYDTDFHALDFEERIKVNYQSNLINTSPVIIDDGVFVGAGSFILKGVHIGKNSVIGAGSVVTKDVPAFEIWGGNPARFLKLNK